MHPRELEVLESVKPEDVEKTRELRRQDIVHAHCRRMWRIFILWHKVCKDSHYAEVTIINRHTYITRL